jgi:3-deoxy-D-manno-octulosonic-acid transferase
MPYLLNFIYLVVWLFLTPWLCWQAWFHRKPPAGMAAKWFGPAAQPLLDGSKPVAWFHGVSVGEIHLLRQVVAKFRSRFPHWQCVVSTTTRTGHAEACKHFADLPVIFWPFDFTWAVNAALRTIRPGLVVLSEGEIWPNFVAAAHKRGIPIALINGRMSPRSARRFAIFRGLLKGVFTRIDLIGAQSEEYRRQYERLGAPAVVTTGNIKYDGVNLERKNAKTLALRTLFSLSPDALVWVAGSTQDPEEALCIDIYRHARTAYPQLRLILVPRHPERFDEVAHKLQRSGLPFVRRSGVRTGEPPPADAIILVDTIGELSAVWGLADLAFVGGSLDGKRGGQNMIEPSAYGAAVLFGPHTWNFKQTVSDLLARQAAIQVQDRAGLQAEVLRLLGDSALRARLGHAARDFVLSQQGATERTLEELAKLMEATQSNTIAA